MPSRPLIAFAEQRAACPLSSSIVLDKAEAQRKPEIQPERIRDDLLLETVALVAESKTLHTAVSMPNSHIPPLCDSTPEGNDKPFTYGLVSQALS